MRTDRKLFACFIALAIGFCSFMVVENATAAEWRWSTPKFHLKHIKPRCSTAQCSKAAHSVAVADRTYRKAKFTLKREREWTAVTNSFIPDCTWFGESGTGAKYARYRYTLPNSEGSGAYGKFQMMSGTYFSNSKYGDWSPLDQEIAARREYHKHGTSPWSNCG